MNILVTNYENGGENVMVFLPEDAGITATMLENALKAVHKTFTEVYEVQDNECQYYLYEPLWADSKFIEGIKNILKNLQVNLQEIL